MLHHDFHTSPASVLQSLPDLVQVQGTCNPDWAPVTWSDDASQHLRTPCLIIIHVYAYCIPDTADERPAPGHILPRQPADKQKAANHMAVQQEVPRQPLPTADPAASSRVSTGDETAGDDDSCDSAHQPWHQHTGPTETLPPPAARQALILSAEVILDELHLFQDDLAAVDVCLPPNTLVLELTDGLCLFPSLTLSHASSDLSHLSDKAAASIHVTPGSPAWPGQAMTEHALPDAGSLTEQVCSFKLSRQPFCL